MTTTEGPADAVAIPSRSEAGPGGRAVLLPALAAGVFAGVCLFDLLPAALQRTGGWTVLLWALGGAACFVPAGRLSHASGDRVRRSVPVVAMGIHSYVEGLLAAAAYVVSPAFGLAVSLGLVGHLAPELAALAAVLVDRGVPLRQSVGRSAGLLGMVAVGVGSGRFLLPGLTPVALGSALAFAAGALAYLACATWRQRGAGPRSGWAAAAAGAAFMALPLLLG
jgi:zinc and cadmium transporter